MITKRKKKEKKHKQVSPGLLEPTSPATRLCHRPEVRSEGQVRKLRQGAWCSLEAWMRGREEKVAFTGGAFKMAEK